jgi:hypothetical protein
MRILIVLFVFGVLFAQEVLIFKKKNWNKLVKSVDKKTEKIIDHIKD